MVYKPTNLHHWGAPSCGNFPTFQTGLQDGLEIIMVFQRLPQLLSFSNRSPPCHITQRKICQLLELCGLAIMLVAMFIDFVGCYMLLSCR